jgi:hypothetical protein
VGLGDSEEGPLPAIEGLVHHVLEAGDPSAFGSDTPELGRGFGPALGLLLDVHF